ncbi:MAG: hypothetical protein WC603_00580 [Candidatus Paceibacterota bacterium]|jgi:hypothetical protein
MINISSSIIIGVVSGIITSAVIWVIVNLFKKNILPWYQSITYQGVKIGGNWIGFYQKPTNINNDEKDPHYNIHIIQKGHHICGEMTRNKDQNGSRNSKTFIFNGLFKDGNLVFSYKPKDSTRLGLGSYVLKLGDDGKKLHGRSLYITSNGGDVAEFEITWKRKS